MPCRSVPITYLSGCPDQSVLVSMVTSVGMSPPWSLPAPPRWRRIDLCPSLVSLSFFFFPLPQGRQCLFEVRSVLDGHGIGTNLVRTNFLWSQMAGMIIIRKIIYLTIKIFISIIFNHSSVDFSSRMNLSWIPWKHLFFCTSSWADGRCSIICLLLLPVTVPVRSPFI